MVDRASAAVLAFVARRLTGTRVGLLAAARTGEDSFFEHSGIAGREILPLDDSAAAALLDERFPALTPRVRQRLVAEAQGNPLALLELPAALRPSRSSPAGPLPAVLPLGRRLQTVFAARVENLPTATRDALPIAALDGFGDLAVLEPDDSGGATVDHLASDERARVVSVDAASRRVVFRHSLILLGIGILMALIDRRRRALHDLIAGTAVVYRGTLVQLDSASSPGARPTKVRHVVDSRRYADRLSAHRTQSVDRFTLFR